MVCVQEEELLNGGEGVIYLNCREATRKLKRPELGQGWAKPEVTGLQSGV